MVNKGDPLTEKLYAFASRQLLLRGSTIMHPCTCLRQNCRGFGGWRYRLSTLLPFFAKHPD